MALCYDNGTGVVMNKATAFELFRGVIKLGKRRLFPALMCLVLSLGEQGLGDSEEAVTARDRAMKAPVHEHALIRGDASDARAQVLVCDICASFGDRPATLWSCLECDYDECLECFARHVHVPRKIE